MDTQRFAAVRVGDVEVGVIIDIDLQQVEEDSRVYDGANKTEMDDHARKEMDERRAGRKKAIKGYRTGLACWAAFCERRHFTDKDLVHEKKILLFLKEEVLVKRTAKRKARGTSRATGNGSSSVFSPSPTLVPAAPQMVPLKPETIEAAYVSPLIDLWTEQSSLGSNPYPHPRGALLRGQMKSLKQGKVRRLQAREVEEPKNVRIRNVLPDLEETVCSTREAVLSRVDLQSTQLLTRTLEEGFTRVIDNLNALRTSIPEQLLTIPRTSVINQATATAVPPSSTASFAAATAGSSFVPLNYWRPARRTIRSECRHGCCQAGSHAEGCVDLYQNV